MSNRPVSPLRGCVRTALASALAALALPALAALGGAPMNTPADATTTAIAAPVVRAASTAEAASGTAATAPYTLRTTQLSSGTIVREYVGANGNVFAIAWNGPSMPDLQALLGAYFSEYASGVKALHAVRRSRGPVAVEASDLVVHSGGHMGSFFGQAWLPSALPAGMTGADIK